MADPRVHVAAGGSSKSWHDSHEGACPSLSLQSATVSRSRKRRQVPACSGLSHLSPRVRLTGTQKVKKNFSKTNISAPSNENRMCVDACRREGQRTKEKPPQLSVLSSSLLREVTGPPRRFSLWGGSPHTVVLLSAFQFFSTDFHALSHESLTGKGFVSFSLAFCESNDALMLPHFSLFFIPYLLKEGIPLYW